MCVCVSLCIHNVCVCVCVRARAYIYKVAEMTLWAMASLVLAMPFALRMVSTLLRLTLLGTSAVGASILCKTLQSPLSLEHDPVWGSVLIHGWQSFSYAGYQRTDVFLGIVGALRRALWLLGIWTQQPAPQACILLLIWLACILLLVCMTRKLPLHADGPSLFRGLP